MSQGLHDPASERFVLRRAETVLARAAVTPRYKIHPPRVGIAEIAASLLVLIAILV